MSIFVCVCVFVYVIIARYNQWYPFNNDFSLIKDKDWLAAIMVVAAYYLTPFVVPFLFISSIFLILKLLDKTNRFVQLVKEIMERNNSDESP